MAPAKISKTDRALTALAEQAVEGPKDHMIQFATDETLFQAVEALRAEGLNRSKAVRYLIQQGARAVVAERQHRA